MYPLTKAYHLDSKPSENELELSHRIWFVAHQKPKTKTEFLQAVKWSKIDANIKFKKCVYSDEAMDIVKRIQVPNIK